MIKEKYIIKNEDGLHARPASEFCRVANTFKSSVTINKNGESYEAKSILMLLSLSAVQGDEIEIIVDGEDESEAIKALIDVLETE